MFCVRKLVGWQVDAFSLPAGSTRSSLVYLLDKLSSRCFLMDSGASVSLFPAPTLSSSSNVKLLTVDSSSVLFSGTRIIPLPFGSCSFDWLFQLATVSVPILAMDFLCHHILLLDVANQKVCSSSSPGSPAILLTSSPPPSSFSHEYLSSPLPSVSPTCSFSSLMFCPSTVLQLLCLIILPTTIFSLIQDLSFLPNLAPGP